MTAVESLPSESERGQTRRESEETDEIHVPMINHGGNLLCSCPVPTVPFPTSPLADSASPSPSGGKVEATPTTPGAMAGLSSPSRLFLPSSSSSEGLVLPDLL